MKVQQGLLMLFCIVFANNLPAYGSSGGGSKKACKKPKFTQYNPPHLSSVSPQAEFSFMSSASTLPGSIRVSIKNNPVDVQIREQNHKFMVTGKLPDNIRGAHARINITATGSNKCKGSGGWLLKVDAN